MTTPPNPEDMTERLRELVVRLRARTVKKYTMILDDGEIERHSGTITQHLHPDAIEAADTIDHLTAALDEANARADRMREALVRIEAAPAWGFEATPAEVRQLARQALATPPDTDKRAAALSDLAALDGESI